MQNSTKILLGIFVISQLIHFFFLGDTVDSIGPPLGASVTEIENHLYSLIPVALVGIAAILSGALLVVRGISHYFRKS